MRFAEGGGHVEDGERRLPNAEHRGTAVCVVAGDSENVISQADKAMAIRAIQCQELFSCAERCCQRGQPDHSVWVRQFFYLLQKHIVEVAATHPVTGKLPPLSEESTDNGQRARVALVDAGNDTLDIGHGG